jgi:hypothetical protein
MILSFKKQHVASRSRLSGAGKTALLLLCAIAMALAFSIAPASRPAVHKQMHAEAQSPMVVRGRARETGLHSDDGSLVPCPQFTVWHHHSRRSFTPHSLAEAANFPEPPTRLVSKFWSPPRYDFVLPSALHPVFTPPIRL